MFRSATVTRRIRAATVQRLASTELISKVYPSAAAAVADIKDNSKLLVGGFGLCGIPEFLIAALKEAGPK